MTRYNRDLPSSTTKLTSKVIRFNDAVTWQKQATVCTSTRVSVINSWILPSNTKSSWELSRCPWLCTPPPPAPHPPLASPPAGNCPWIIAPELCESRGGRSGLPAPNSHYCLCGCQATSEFRSCVKVEAAVLGSPSLTVITVSVDVKQHQNSGVVWKSRRPFWAPRP